MNMEKSIFIAHYVECWWNLCLDWRIFGFLHRWPMSRFLLLLIPAFWPVVMYNELRGIWWIFSRKSFNVVDHYVFTGNVRGRKVDVDCQTVLIRAVGWHFLIKALWPQINKKIMAAVQYAVEQGSIRTGLGALTKFQPLNGGGKKILSGVGQENMGGKWLMHCDTGTASIADQGISRICDREGIDKIFLTGPTSKTGSVLALRQAQKGREVLCFTSDAERFKALQNRARKLGINPNLLILSQDLKDGKGCPLWVFAKSKPGAKVLNRYMPRDSWGMNIAVPSAAEGLRRDINVVEAGLVECTPEMVKRKRHNMRLKRRWLYSCDATRISETANGRQGHEVGDVEFERIDESWQQISEFGFRLLPLPERKRHRALSLRPIVEGGRFIFF